MSHLQHYVGLDVSVKETALCIVDPHGRVVHRASVESDPRLIGQYLLDPTDPFPAGFRL